MVTTIHVTLILELFLVAYALTIGVRLLLNRLNISHLRSVGDRVPENFRDLLDPKSLAQMSDYTVATSRLGSLEHLTEDILIIVILLSGLLPRLNDWITSWGLNFVLSGISFFFACSLLMAAATIPFDLYRNFVIEKRFSFNTMTLGLWLSDLFKSLTISAVVMGIFLAVFFSLILHAENTWWLWAWLFFICFQLLITWLYPVVIAPLFNRFDPIEDDELKDRITALASRSGIRVKGLYQMDAGKRSTHSNAYFTGIGKSKRIVLFDTLIEDHSPDEIAAVLAHELGHWKMGHVRKQLVLSMGLSAVILYLAYACVTHPLLYETFGFKGTSLYAGLFLITIIARPFAFFLSPLGSMLSRHFERQADDYACWLTADALALATALKHLARKNLSNLHPHPAYAWFYYSHPPLVERIQRLEDIAGAPVPVEAAR